MDLTIFIISMGAATGFASAATVNDMITSVQRWRLLRDPPPRVVRNDDERVRRRSAGTLLIAAGVMLVVFAWIGVAALQQSSASLRTPGLGILGGVVTCLGCIAGSILVTRGRRMRAPDGAATLASDPRLPILYLRPFVVDRLGRQAVAHSPAFSRTSEERLARAVRGIGPFVALGDPTDRLPERGALRVYADEPEWQQAVGNLASRAGTIILQVGDSAGLEWEVEHVVGLGRPERLILSLASEFRGLGAGAKFGRLRDLQRYRGFREKLGHLFPRGLPADVGGARLVYFEADWTARALEREHLREFSSRTGADGAQRALVLDVLVRAA